MKKIVDIKFAKVHPNAIIPSKRDEDMGFDIYACFNEDYIAIKPHETKLIPTGIASACNSDYGFLVFERGSTGSKGIARRCGVIDSGYRNEWFVGLTNTTSGMLFITKLSEEDTKKRFVEDFVKEYIERSKTFENPLSESSVREFAESNTWGSISYSYSKAIAQTLVVPVPKTKVKEISYDELKAIKSERGMGALGSTNKKDEYEQIKIEL